MAVENSTVAAKTKEPTISLLFARATALQTAAFRIEAVRDTLSLLQEALEVTNKRAVSVLYGTLRLLEEAQACIEHAMPDEEASNG